MRWFKLVITVIILGLIGFFVYQNLSTFEQSLAFKYELGFMGKAAWTHPLYSVIAISAGIGFLVGLLLMMKPFLGTRRRLKEARKTAAAPAPAAPVVSSGPAVATAAAEPEKQSE
jgi:hypothetical protein